MRYIFFTVLLAIATVEGRSLLTSTDESGKPDSPPYEIVNSTDSLEIRRYEAATWAVAYGRSRWSVDLASYYAGAALFKYFNGGNVAHAKIKPTIPLVATILKPPRHHNHSVNATKPGPPKPHHPRGPPKGPPAIALGAYLPEKYQGDAPIPDGPSVKIVNTNETKVYVHKFGGWAVSFVVKHEIGHLRKALKDVGICPKKGKFFLATYNGPWKVFGRHNEILFAKAPKHKHGNDSSSDSQTFVAGSGFEAFNVKKLFPEEFGIEDLGQDNDTRNMYVEMPAEGEKTIEFLS